MNPDPENFDALRRLLTLKHYEQPPPGYFNNFSSQVIARIRAGQRGEPASFLGRLLGEAAWWQRLRAALESRPGFAGAFGAAVCALLLSGIVYSENAPAPVAQAFVPAESSAPFAAAVVAANDSLDQPELGSGSTNPLATPADSLFDRFPFPKAQPVSLAIPVGN